ncbi:AraC family transcriptional regulator [Glaciimonas soli]|uniref:Helix-turn-helix domain-containing protein n=1 Tax=Glaciimonas soli TaxID=2590999 RepID=A0A843YRF0_9BURK|nr:helix-turn-helix transcriptional regulator [Glaciimonas soli]MQR00567.1 helix-turn-helix domain-containing protein [Glaciimonas soli]
MPKATPPSFHDNITEGKSIARQYPRGMHIDPHAHEWAQVLYAVEGVMWVEAEREALIVPPQRAVWLPAGTVHSIQMLSAVDMRNLYLHECKITHLSKQSDVFEVSKLLRELISTITDIDAKGDIDEEYVQAAFGLVVLELERAPRSSFRIPLPAASESDRRLEMLCRAVIANPSIAISFEQHAASAGASVRTLSRLFIRELGVGFAEWRRQVQLAVAVSKLAEGVSVSNIAREFGYLTSSFSDMFRRELGTSPTKFQAAKTLSDPDKELLAAASQ